MWETQCHKHVLNKYHLGMMFTTRKTWQYWGWFMALGLPHCFAGVNHDHSPTLERPGKGLVADV
jgi:hypothetical protein